MDRSIMDMKKKKVTLISSNGMIFEDLDLAMLSGCRVIKARIEKAMNEEEEEEEEEEEGCCGDDKIITLRVPEITGKILALVLDYCRNSTNHDDNEEDDLKRWKAKLATEVDDATLAHLLLAADYLDMWELVSLGGDVMGDKDRTPEEINEIFERKLESEEEEVSRRSLWLTEEAPVDF